MTCRLVQFAELEIQTGRLGPTFQPGGPVSALQPDASLHATPPFLATPQTGVLLLALALLLNHMEVLEVKTEVFRLQVPLPE